MITQGDWFQTQVNYSQGATKYLNNGDDTDYSFANGNGTTIGVMSDCVFGGAATGSGVGNTGCNLTTGWDVSASYEHFWTPSVHESFFGAYMAIDYNAQANAMLCSIGGAGIGAGFGSGAVAGAGCNNNWNYWTAGSRLQWDVTKSFYLGVEALYTTVNGATTPGAAAGGYAFAGANAATGPQVIQNRASAWVFTVRAHRDFLP